MSGAPNTLAVICARGGSRGVPGKNIRPIAGHPLIAYTIAQARACPFLKRIVVSTDSTEIAEIAGAYGADVPFIRPTELAADTSPKVPVLKDAVEWVERETGSRLDIVVDLDVTSPIRTPEDIRACWDLVQTAGTRVVFTVIPADRNPYFNMVELVDGYARLVKPPPSPITRRQDAPPVFSMNASIYAYRRDHLMTTGSIVGHGSRIHVMPPIARDVDTLTDLAFLEFLIREGVVSLIAPVRRST